MSSKFIFLSVNPFWLYQKLVCSNLTEFKFRFSNNSCNTFQYKITEKLNYLGTKSHLFRALLPNHNEGMTSPLRSHSCLILCFAPSLFAPRRWSVSSPLLYVILLNLFLPHHILTQCAIPTAIVSFLKKKRDEHSMF